MYLAVAIAYHHLFGEETQLIFEHLSGKINASIKRLSGTLCFILGFYVNIIVKRWWLQWSNIPCPDKVAHTIQSSIIPKAGKENDPIELAEIRRIKKNLLRYVSLASVLVFMKIATPVRNAFKNKDKLIEMNYMTHEENVIMESCKDKCKHWNYWIPFLWFTNLVTKCQSEGRVKTPPQFINCINSMNSFREELRNLVSFDWINIPLVYTQVVTIATYSYFTLCIFGYQTLKTSEEDIQDLLFFSDVNNKFENRTKHVFLSIIPYINRYIPFYMILEIIFYMGLLKVAEELINPFGDDDEDFPILEVLTRNYEVSMLIIDQDFLTSLNNPILMDKQDTDTYDESKSEMPDTDTTFPGNGEDIRVALYDGNKTGEVQGARRKKKIRKRQKLTVKPTYKGSLYQKKNKGSLHVRLDNLMSQASDTEKARLRLNKNLSEVKVKSMRESKMMREF